MGMVFKNIEYMNGGCFENLSGTSVPKSIGRGPPGAILGLSLCVYVHYIPHGERRDLEEAGVLITCSSIQRPSLTKKKTAV
jgi:hypothetical protein